MSLSTYSGLRLEVANVIGRSDILANIPSMIALAESQMNQRLDARSQDTIATLTATANVQTLAGPSDVIDMRNLSVTSTRPVYSLEYMTPDNMFQLFGDGATGIPQKYALVGNTIYLYPIPDAAYTLTCIYKQRIPALSDSNTTNSILANYPDVYLYGALANAGPYIMDERIGQWRDLFSKAIDGINVNDWYSGAGMAVRTDTYNG
jgi:hypothetical protein